MGEDNPTPEEINTWGNERIALRALVLGAMCADKSNKSIEWADAELRRLAPLVNERFGGVAENDQ